MRCHLSVPRSRFYNGRYFSPRFSHVRAYVRTYEEEREKKVIVILPTIIYRVSLLSPSAARARDPYSGDLVAISRRADTTEAGREFDVAFSKGLPVNVGTFVP